MSGLSMLALVVLEVMIIGILLWILPRVGRSGLLFGIYVGEQHTPGPESDRIRRIYDSGLWAAVAIVLGLSAAWVILLNLPANGLVSICLLAGFLVAYLRAHGEARKIAPQEPPPDAVAPLTVRRGTRYLLPVVALSLGIGAGLFAIAYAWHHYEDLPLRVPIHFGPTGKPDGWVDRSPGAVMVMPLLTLVMAIILGGISFLVANAKRAVRRDGGASLEAQERFSCAMVRFLAVVSLLATAMMAVGSISSVQVALGTRTGLHPLFLIFTVALVAYALGGILYIALRYGQGGARLERSATASPLTDGLADNRSWPLGLFYLNRQDPSIIVEKRFGIGYMVNIGNWKGILVLIGAVVLPLLIALLAVMTM
jgi:uncharacterized membrane protein